MQFSRLAAALVLLGLSSCGGGGGDGGGPPGATRFTLTGQIAVIGDSAADSDVNDPQTTPVANNQPGQAQAVPNPVTIGGYANKPNNGADGPSFAAGDEFDGFAVPLSQNQNINLFIAEPSAGDMDLFLFDANLNLVDSSEGTGQDETVTAPATGNYSVVVFAFSGAS